MDKAIKEARAQRFLDALDELVEAGEGWEHEIEEAVRLLDPEETTGFVQRAGRACGTLGDMVGNLLIDAEVKLPVRQAAAAAGVVR